MARPDGVVTTELGTSLLFRRAGGPVGRARGCMPIPVCSAVTMLVAMMRMTIRSAIFRRPCGWGEPRKCTPLVWRARSQC